MKKHTAIFLLFCCFAFLLMLVACNGEGENGGGHTEPPPSGKSDANDQPKPPPVKFSAGDAYDFVKKQVEFGPRVPGSPAHKKCADWLTQTLRQFADTVFVQQATLKLSDGKPVPMYNIIGAFKPQSKNRVLLCAHWDTRPIADQDNERTDQPIDGANDGGSGVGVLLEIARQLKASPPNFGIDIILFDTEDSGMPNKEDSYCLGSQYWSKNPHVPGYKAKYGILLDMVGAGDAVFLMEEVSMKYASSVMNKVWDTAHKLGYDSYFKKRMTYPVTDDHLYINEIANIPTIDIIHYDPTVYENHFGDFWHTHDDNLKIISKTTLSVVGKTVLTVLQNEKFK